MSTNTVMLSGEAFWTKVKEPDQKFKKWGLDLYMDDESFAKYKESGMGMSIREAEDGRLYVKFSRPTSKVFKDKLVQFDPPAVWKDKEPFKGYIGNGSKVTIKVSYFDTAQGVGHRLDAVRVDELVEYDPDNNNFEDVGSTADELPF